MDDPFRALSAQESAEADSLAARAALAARGLLAGLVAVLARIGPVSEPRTDPLVLISRGQIAGSAERHAREEIIDAIIAGYRTDARGRTAAMGLRATVTFSDAEDHALAGFPIHGHTAGEIARHLALILAYALDGVLVEKGGAVEVSEVAAAHGERVGNAVREGYFFGVKAATLAIGEALVA